MQTRPQKTSTQTMFGTLVGDTLVGPSCGTHSLWKSFEGHFCALLRDTLWDTLAKHSCRTLLRDTLVGHPTLLCDTLSRGTLLRNILVGYSCGTLGHSCIRHYCTLVNTLVGRSCGTLLWGHSCGARLRNTLVPLSCGYSYETLSPDTLAAHSRRTLLWKTLVGNICRTLLSNTLVALPHGALYK